MCVCGFSCCMCADLGGGCYLSVEIVYSCWWCVCWSCVLYKGGVVGVCVCVCVVVMVMVMVMVIVMERMFVPGDDSFVCVRVCIRLVMC